jgi:hypothetical protein
VEKMRSGKQDDCGEMIFAWRTAISKVRIN